MTDSDSDCESYSIIHLQEQHSGKPVAKQTAPPSEEAKKDESSTSSVSSKTEVIQKKLLSFDEIIATTDLTFKQFTEQSDVHVEGKRSLDRVPASSALHPGERNPPPDSQDAQSALREFGLPDHSWHVPVPLTEIVAEQQAQQERTNKRERKHDTQSGGPQQKVNKVKDKEKTKRQKGQSTHESWKSETWMKLRQQFD